MIVDKPTAPSVAPEPLHVDETKRYRVVQKGYWWRVQIGDGQQTVGRCFSQTEAQHLAHALVVAYRDGFFVASLSAHPPRAPLTDVKWCAEWIRNNYQDHMNIASLCEHMVEDAERANGISAAAIGGKT